MASSSSADTPRARALGAELRRARERKKLTTRALAAMIGRNGSHISRWEQGKLIPTEADTATVLAHLGVNGEERDRLLELARDAADPDWLAPGIDKQLAVLTEYERTAQTIIEIEPLLVPGLLQTAGYANAVISAFGATRGEADHRTMIRIGRQHVLTDPQPVELVAVIGEYALRYPPCSSVIMVEQLRHLTKMSTMDNVTLQVLPMHHGAAAALMGPWILIEFEKATPVVYLEHYSSSATITEQKSVKTYRAAADTLRGLAMSPTDSAGLIARIIKETE